MGRFDAVSDVFKVLFGALSENEAVGNLVCAGWKLEPIRFENVFIALLKQYSADLQLDARDQPDRRVCGLVLSAAPLISREAKSLLLHPTTTTSIDERAKELEHAELRSYETNDPYHDTRNYTSLSLKWFLLNGKAFQILTQNLKEELDQMVQAWKESHNTSTRVRWNCKCGKVFYEDYEELLPEGAINLQERLSTYYDGSQGNGRRGGIINSIREGLSSLTTFRLPFSIVLEKTKIHCPYQLHGHQTFPSTQLVRLSVYCFS